MSAGDPKYLALRLKKSHVSRPGLHDLIPTGKASVDGSRFKQAVEKKHSTNIYIQEEGVQKSKKSPTGPTERTLNLNI